MIAAFAHAAPIRWDGSREKPREGFSGCFFSIRVPVDQARNNRHQDNSQIEHETPVLEVVQIACHALLDRRVAPPPVHLRPARYSHFQSVAVIVAHDILQELMDEHRDFGTDLSSRSRGIRNRVGQKLERGGDFWNTGGLKFGN